MSGTFGVPAPASGGKGVSFWMSSSESSVMIKGAWCGELRCQVARRERFDALSALHAFFERLDFSLCAAVSPSKVSHLFLEVVDYLAERVPLSFQRLRTSLPVFDPRLQPVGDALQALKFVLGSVRGVVEHTRKSPPKGSERSSDERHEAIAPWDSG